ncbi:MULTISPECIES: helix-turn-helix domain-containing protein [Streptomyces]
MNATYAEQRPRPSLRACPTSLPSAAERRHLREQWGLTPLQVASAFGVTVMTVRSWESGKTSPRGERRQAYARFLEGLAQKTCAPPATPHRVQRPAGAMTVPMRPGASPMVSGRPVGNAPDPISPQRRRRLRLAAAGVGLWSIFVHLMVTIPAPPT